MAITLMAGCAQIVGADWDSYRIGAGGDGGGAGDDAGGSGSGGQGGDTTLGEPRFFSIRIDDEQVPTTELTLDKKKTLDLVGDDGAAQLTLLDLDTERLLRSALDQIQNACGASWRNDAVDPRYDCSLTLLGESFGAEWRTSPEFAFLRLLTMTPANADMTGTSLDELKRFFDSNSGVLSRDFASILAEALGASRTDPFLPADELIRALQHQSLGTHPAIPDMDGQKLPISLHDALNNLTPLSEKLGASGDHPGVLVRDDGTFTTKSDLLRPDFEMHIVAESGLRRVMGVDLSRGGGDMFVQEGDAPLRFDFNDAEKLRITGVAESPIIDLRIALREVPSSVPSCTETPACHGNSPDAPVGDGTIWKASPFLLEPIVAKAAYLAYSDREFTSCYWRSSGECALGVDIGQGDDPLGWTVFNFDLSTPPDRPPRVPNAQFLWELITEVAQVAVHDPTGDGDPEITEGDAQPVYALHGVGLGITAEDVTTGFRQALQSRAREIAENVVGRYWEKNAALDFFYSRSAPGAAPHLYFVAESDLRPSDQSPTVPRDYTYRNPGFYRSPDLGEGNKVSAKEIDGVDDKIHEKFRLPPGETTTLFMQDDEAAIFEVHFHVPDEEDPVEIIAEVVRL
ncbi:hypothetical protein WME95_03805 [Sorangium sp. So ce327]|uniref:hypothetical protein n=1 Tax=Sorangium sp. So ce327 TaxID=3133301 RepID=UPI003F5ECA45